MDAGNYDFIVVGAGSAGCAVAARLSENPDHTVLLLEAGPRDDRMEVRIPAAFSKLFRSPLDWNYETEPQQQLNDRRIYWPRGKVLGGSSTINAMMWIPGFREDYDAWGEAAGASWSWDSLLPYFRKVERVQRVQPVQRVEWVERMPQGEDASDDASETAGAIRIGAQRSPRSESRTWHSSRSN